MKKILSVMLALAMMLSGVVAFAEGEEAVAIDYAQWGATLPIVPEGEEVTLKIAVPQSAENYDWDKVWFWKWASEKMNINFEVEQIPAESVNQRKNLMFASGDLPDIIYGIGFSTSELVKYGQYEGQLLAINEYLNEETMPNLYEWTKHTSMQYCITPDGNQYVLPYIDRVALNIGNGHPIYVNKEWMEELGFEMPDTVEELTELLRAYKAADPDIIPMGGSVVSVNYIMTHLMNGHGLGVLSGDVYGVGPALRKSSEMVVPCATEEYKYYLETMHTWYTEGLISPDFFTMDRTTDMAQAAEGKYAAWAYPMDQVTQDAETVHKYWAVPSLLSANNDVYSVPLSPKTRPGNAVISASTQYPEICAKFMDFFYSPLGMVYGWFGPMAGTEDTLDMVGGWYYNEETNTIDYVDVDNGKFSSSYMYAIGTIAACSGARMNNYGDATFDLEKYPSHTAIQMRMAGVEPTVFEKNPDVLADYPLWTAYSTDSFHHAEDTFVTSYVYFDEETSVAVLDLKNVIQSYVETETAKFITGARSLDEYDSYLNELKAMGVDEYLQYYKDATGR